MDEEQRKKLLEYELNKFKGLCTFAEKIIGESNIADKEKEQQKKEIHDLENKTEKIVNREIYKELDNQETLGKENNYGTGNLHPTREEFRRFRDYVKKARENNLDRKDARKLISKFERARLGADELDLEKAALSNAFTSFHQQLTNGAPIVEFPKTWQAYKELCAEYGLEPQISEETKTRNLSKEILRQKARSTNKELLTGKDSIGKSFLPQYIVKHLGEYRVPILLNSARHKGPFSKDDAKRFFEKVLLFCDSNLGSDEGKYKQKLEDIASQTKSILEDKNYSRASMTVILYGIYDLLDIKNLPSNIDKGITQLAREYGRVIHTYDVRRNSICELQDLADPESARCRRLPPATQAEIERMGTASEELINDHESLIRACAATIMMVTQGKESLPKLRGLIRDPDSEVRRRLVEYPPYFIPFSKEAEEIAAEVIKNETHENRRNRFIEEYEKHKRRGEERAARIAQRMKNLES